MIAADTNILVRLLTQDDLEQYARAKSLFEVEAVYLSDTVLLETEWVLRFAYQFSVAQINASLRGLCGLRQVQLDHPQLMDQALTWHEDGLDFADALHLSKSQHCKELKTFDRAFIRKATGKGVCKVLKP